MADMNTVICKRCKETEWKQVEDTYGWYECEICGQLCEAIDDNTVQ